VAFQLTEVAVELHATGRARLWSAKWTRAATRRVPWRDGDHPSLSGNPNVYTLRLPWFPSRFAAQAERQPRVCSAWLTGPLNSEGPWKSVSFFFQTEIQIWNSQSGFRLAGQSAIGQLTLFVILNRYINTNPMKNWTQNLRHRKVEAIHKRN